MLVDLSFFGDSSALKKEFEDAKHSKDQSISLVDGVHVETSDLSTRYTRGAVPSSEKVKVRALRKTEKKASIIKDGVFELPQAYVNFLGKDSGPVMLVGEPDSWILSIVFLNDDAKLMRMKFMVPDRPGAIYEVMKALGEESINVMAGYTNVLVYYEKMTCEVVVDVHGASGKVADVEEHMRKKMAALGQPFSLVEACEIKS